MKIVYTAYKFWLSCCILCNFVTWAESVQSEIFTTVLWCMGYPVASPFPASSHITKNTATMASKSPQAFQAPVNTDQNK